VPVDAGLALQCFPVASGPARLHSSFGGNHPVSSHAMWNKLEAGMKPWPIPRRGFTLIELLVVIANLDILVEGLKAEHKSV
jgi:hypothetical protein